MCRSPLHCPFLSGIFYLHYSFSCLSSELSRPIDLLCLWLFSSYLYLYLSYVLSSSSLLLSPLQPPRTTAGSRYEHVPASMRIIRQLHTYVTGSKTKTKTKTWTKVNFTSCLQEEGLPAAARGRRLFRVYKRPPSPSLLVTFTFRLFLLFLIR